jgi:hypothetical protein
MVSHHTSTVTLVIQHVVVGKQAANVQDALVEFVNDIAGGRALNSNYERHIQQCGARIDVIQSVHPGSGINGAAVEDVVSGDGNDALKERLLAMRETLKYFPGGENDTAVGRFAYDAKESAKDMRQLVAQQLAAIGVTDESGA